MLQAVQEDVQGVGGRAEHEAWKDHGYGQGVTGSSGA